MDSRQDIADALLMEINPKRDGERSALIAYVNKAYDEVMLRRNYPSDMAGEAVERDMARYRSVVYDVAKYDFNIRGAEFQSVIQEGGEYRSFIDREKLFAPLVSYAVVVE